MYKDSVEWSGDGAKKERRFLKTPNAYGYFTVNIQPLKNLSVALTGTYTGSMLVGHQKTDDYTFTQNGTTITYPGWPEAKAVNTPSFLSMNLKNSIRHTAFTIYQDANQWRFPKHYQCFPT